MFKKRFLLFILTFTTICGNGQSITIGDSNSVDYKIPFTISDNYCYSQQIYLQNEINQAGLICGMSLYKSENINFNRTVKIYLGEIFKTQFTSNNDWILADSILEVFNGNITFNQEGWCYINFNTPFEYENFGNLVITWDDNTQLEEFTLANRFVCSNIENKTLLYHGDSINPVYYNPTIGYLPDKRNIIKLHFCDPLVMSNGIIENCDFLYADPGGMNNYSDSLNIIQTIFSSSLIEQEIQIHFLKFNFEQGDTLWLHDGNSINSPIVGIYTHINIPNFYQSVSDTLTFHFKSDSSLVSSGWLAFIQCVACYPVSIYTGSPCEPNNNTVTGYSAIPFCTEENPYGVSYSSGTTGFATNYFGQVSFACFDIAPAPKWHYMQINEPGDMLIHISQLSSGGTPLDADFACWGPFYAENQFDLMHKLCCDQINLCINPNISHCPPNGDHSDLGPYPDYTLVDCSYSPISSEWCFIPQAQTGQFYILLIANFSGIPGTINFTTVPAYTTATTNCDLLSNAQNNGPLCIGDTLRLFCQNPKPGQTYLWSGPNGFSSTEPNPIITNCNSSHSGMYSLVITFGSICSQPYLTYVVIGSQPTISLESSASTICYGDSVVLKAYGGIHYDWSHFYEDTDSIIAFPSESTSYSVIGRFGGCMDSASIEIEVLPPITYSITKNNIICYGINEGQITMEVAGGVPPYQLYWSTGDTSSTINSLSIGGYYAIITDHFGCSFNTPYIEISSPPSINADATTTSDRCNMFLGSIITSISGGVEPYSFVWDYLNSTSPNLTQLPEGVYSCLITDGNGCIKHFQDTIFDKSIYTYIDSISPALCGKNNGWITIKYENGIPPIHYDWLSILDYDENKAFNLAPGIYEVIVSDNLCSDTIQFEIDEMPFPTACFETLPTNSFETNSIIDFINCSDGANNWVWNFGDYTISYFENPSHTYQNGGIYTIGLVVSNEIGCEDSTSKTIEIKNIDLFVPNSFTPNGDGINDQFIPIMNSVSSEGYIMSIYNRWGELVFQTTDIHQGWDGMHDGVYVPVNSTYSYLIKYTNRNGKSFQKTGGIHVIQ